MYRTPFDAPAPFEVVHDLQSVPEQLVLEEALAVALPAISYHLGRRVQEYAQGRPWVRLAEPELDFRALAADEGFCDLVPHPAVHAEHGTTWASRGQLGTFLRTSWSIANWNRRRFEVVRLEWAEAFDRRVAQFVIGDEADDLRAFVAEALDATHVPRKSILVYGGCFSKDRSLYEAVNAASWDDLVLQGDLVERLRNEVVSFLGARELYREHGVPYKRGLLLSGPPGNGKTHTVRLLIKEAALPCIYVKTFEAKYGEEAGRIADVFARARRIAPCMLVLEDLDSLVRPHCLSSFLNEMDGLRADTGIFTVATTNHPERLDPALLERPSRFDRKVHLGLPALGERRRYLERWNARLSSDMRLAEADLDVLAERTEKSSYAFLKELMVTAMTRWIADRRPGTMGEIASREHDALKATWRAVDEGDPPPRPARPENDDE